MEGGRFCMPFLGCVLGDGCARGCDAQNLGGRAIFLAPNGPYAPRRRVRTVDKVSKNAHASIGRPRGRVEGTGAQSARAHGRRRQTPPPRQHTRRAMAGDGGRLKSTPAAAQSQHHDIRAMQPTRECSAAAPLRPLRWFDHGIPNPAPPRPPYLSTHADRRGPCNFTKRKNSIQLLQLLLLRLAPLLL